MTPDRDRYFIEGSYQSFSGDVERATESYRALVRLYPDHTWGMNNLSAALEGAGRRHEAMGEIVKLAQRRPDDLQLVALAAVETLVTKGIAAARPYVAQAKSLSAAQRPPTAFHAIWLALFGAHEHWLAGRPEDAGRSLETATASRVGGAQARAAAGYFYLALGRAGAAAATFEQIADPVVKSQALATVALARGQLAEISRILEGYEGRDAICALILLRANDPARAQDLFNRIVERTGPSVGDPAYDFIRAEVDATLPVSAKLEVLTRVEAPPLFWDTARYYLHVETLSSLLQESGNTDAALRVLQRATSYRERVHKEPNHIGYFWMRVQKRLADAYRAVGNTSEAESIEADLLRVLDTADPDLPLLLELRARRGTVQVP